MFNEGQYPQIIREVLDETPAGARAIRDIPLWDAEPENTPLPGRCQAKWIERFPGSRRR
jgi:hypothetical protein